MRRPAILALSLLVLAISGCTHTELTRRYISKSFAEAPIAPTRREYVRVYAFVIDTPAPPSAKPILQLAPEGQKGFMEAVAAKAKSLDEVYQALDYKGKDSEGGDIDKTVFHKRVVFSVEKDPPGKGEHDLTPADRINYLKVTLELKKDNKNNPEFADWLKFDTKEKTIDLGTLRRTQHTSTEGTMTVGPAAQAMVPVSGTGKIATEKTIDENIQLQHHIITMTGAIKDEKKKAELFQESDVGYDLTGNFIVDFTIKLPNHKHSGIIIPGPFEKEGKPLKPEEVKIDFGNLMYPVSSEPVEGELTSNYIIRHVWQPLPSLYDLYDRELAEGLHRVIFIKGESSPDKKNKVELISQRELRTVIYEIVKGNGNEILYLGHPVTFQTEAKTIDRNPLRFAKFDDARRFLSWIKRNKANRVGDYQIYQVSKSKLANEASPIGEEDIEYLHIKAIAN